MIVVTDTALSVGFQVRGYLVKHTSFGDMQCPVARSLEKLGEWWSMLILRDALQGYTRFDEFQRSLGIGPSMLTKRLKELVDAGMLERRRYMSRPPRYEYVVTARCREFEAVLVALLAFGNRHFAPEGKSVTVVDADTGIEAEPVVVDLRTGRPIVGGSFRWTAGPAADEDVVRRYSR